MSAKTMSMAANAMVAMFELASVAAAGYSL
jgi:hypothetical protein